MNAKEIISLMGGRKEVMVITGLSKGRLSQWVTEDSVPRYWMLEFHLRKPKLIPDPRKEPAHA